MRGYWLIGLLVMVLIAVTAAYIRLVLVMSENRSGYEALPTSVSLVFEFRQPAESMKKFREAAFHEDLSKAAFYRKLMYQLDAVDSLFRIKLHDTTFSLREGSTMLASLSITGRDAFDFLYVIKSKKFSREKFALFTEAPDERDFGRRIYRDEVIYEITLASAKKPVSVSFVNGLLLISYTPFLVEEAIAQLRSGVSLLDDPGFREVSDLGGEDADGIVYIRFDHIRSYLPMIFNEEYANLFQPLADFAGWMELDLKIRNNSFIINGYTRFAEDHYLSRFTVPTVSQIELTRVMPYKTALFFYYSADDFYAYMSRLGKILSPELDNFRNWMGNEWCFGVLEPLDKNFQEDAFLIVKAIDPDIAIQSLAERARFTGADLQLEEFKAYPIGQLASTDSLSRLFDHHFVQISSPYYTVVDNFVVFANQVSVIKTILGNYEDNQTLANDPEYMVFERNLTSSANLYIYFNTSRCAEILHAALSNSLLTDIRKGDKNFLHFSPAALQFNYYENIFFTSGYIMHSTQTDDYRNVLWQVRLDAPAAMAPVFVVNHYTNEKEILVQDSLYNLYLITKAGKILWKRQLDGLIMSKIYLIDFYENTKLQYAFNTANMIYVIDRKGDNVASYPLRLPAPATNGLLITDYDKNRDYRLFVACENGNIYGFYKSGKPLPGWSPQKNTGRVRYPMKYALVEGKDYLIAANENGEVFYFNRRGERRAKPIKLDYVFDTDFGLRLTRDNFQLMNADKDGNLYKVYRNGSFSKQKQNIPKNFFDLLYDDLLGDGRYEFVFADSLIVKIYDENLKEVASPSFAEKINKVFIVEVNDKKNVGLLSSEARKIYYLDSTFAIYQGFPLSASTPFIMADLFETGRNVVIAGDEKNNLIAYQVR
ncbi:MAG: hypothetical protein KatS3mg031_1053 [Chitinophagales bacterium]|nr:MAG: hypothetical protein KatS3mg031_1053 [Chitinophagales bacterium]